MDFLLFLDGFPSAREGNDTDERGTDGAIATARAAAATAALSADNDGTPNVTGAADG